MSEDINGLLKDILGNSLDLDIPDLLKDSLEPSIQDIISKGEFNFEGIKHSFDVSTITDFIPKIQLTDNFELNQFLDNPTASLPLLQNSIIKNVQNLAFDVGEKLLGEFGSNMNITSSLVCPGKSEISNIAGHFSGNSMDIVLGGFGDNMFSYMKDIEKMLDGKISQIGLIYDMGSWIHISTINTNISSISNPIKYTLDKVNGNFIKDNFSPIRGVF